MRVDTLPSPGVLHMGLQIRTMMAKAISGIEVTAGVSGGKASAAAQLDAFLVASRTAISSFIELVLPTVASSSIRASLPNKIYLAATEGLDPQFVPGAAAFVIAGVTKVVDKVEIDGPFIILTVTVPFASGNVSTVAYTQPGSIGLRARDLSGNIMASFTAMSIANGVISA